MRHVADIEERAFEGARVETSVTGTCSFMNHGNKKIEIFHSFSLCAKQLYSVGQVHDEVILEGPTESAEEAKAIVVDCMTKPFDGENFLRVGLSVDAKCAQNWYAAK